VLAVLKMQKRSCGVLVSRPVVTTYARRRRHILPPFE
jgi:hypothetical protein